MSDRKGKRARDYSDYSYIPADVIKKAVNGETEAMEQIIIRYAPYVKATIRGIAIERNLQLSKELFEDIEQTVWEHIIRKIKKFKI